jgi:hypothetical protein
MSALAVASVEAHGSAGHACGPATQIWAAPGTPRGSISIYSDVGEAVGVYEGFLPAVQPTPDGLTAAQTAPAEQLLTELTEVLKKKSLKEKSLDSAFDAEGDAEGEGEGEGESHDAVARVAGVSGASGGTRSSHDAEWQAEAEAEEEEEEEVHEEEHEEAMEEARGAMAVALSAQLLTHMESVLELHAELVELTHTLRHTADVADHDDASRNGRSVPTYVPFESV